MQAEDGCDGGLDAMVWWRERVCAHHALEFRPPVPLSPSECIPSDVGRHFMGHLSKTKLKTICQTNSPHWVFLLVMGVIIISATQAQNCSCLCLCSLPPLIASNTRLSGLCSVSPDHPTRVPPPWIHPPPSPASPSPPFTPDCTHCWWSLLNHRVHFLLLGGDDTPHHSLYPNWVIWSLFLCKLISKLKLFISLVFPEYYKCLQETKFTDGPNFCEFILTFSHAQVRALFFLTCCSFLAQHLLLKCNCLGYPLKLITTQGSAHLSLPYARQWAKGQTWTWCVAS